MFHILPLTNLNLTLYIFIYPLLLSLTENTVLVVKFWTKFLTYLQVYHLRLGRRQHQSEAKIGKSWLLHKSPEPSRRFKIQTFLGRALAVQNGHWILQMGLLIHETLLIIKECKTIEGFERISFYILCTAHDFY